MKQATIDLKDLLSDYVQGNDQHSLEPEDCNHWIRRFYRIQAGLEFEVEVVDVGNQYGNLRFQIKPLGQGTGNAWVQEQNIKFSK